MNQQSERVGLGGGGGAPMDQQQGAWSGELATVPGVKSGQGIGRVPIGYVCHAVSFISRNALSAATLGAFRIYGPKITGGCATHGVSYPRSVHLKDPTMQPIVAGILGVCTPFGVEFLTWATLQGYGTARMRKPPL